MEILKIIPTALLTAVALFITAKIIGHKQLSQLDFFDYITGITIGSIGAEMAIDSEAPEKPFVALLVFGAVSVVLSLISHRFPKTRKFLNGTPTVVMKDGRIYRENLKKAKLDLSELMLLLRTQGYFNPDEIQLAVFEPNGKLSVMPYAHSRPLTPDDMSLSVKPMHIWVEIIMDGRVLDGNLKRLKRDTGWLEGQLHDRGYASPKEIFLALTNESGELRFYEMHPPLD